MDLEIELHALFEARVNAARFNTEAADRSSNIRICFVNPDCSTDPVDIPYFIDKDPGIDSSELREEDIGFLESRPSFERRKI